MAEIFEAKTRDDLRSVRDLFKQYADFLGFDLGFQDFAAELANLPCDYAAPDGCILPAQQGEKIVGCVALRRWDHSICEMKRLYVLPKMRGKGIGRKLAEAIILRAREMGYKRMRLDTLASMGAANRLYPSLGFRPIAPYRYNPMDGAQFYQLSL